MKENIIIKRLGECDYQAIFDDMLEFTQQRKDDEPDQIWLLQHSPVYTQGTACKLNTFLPSDIPVIKTDRGGQITYHGPGQIIMYPLIKLKRYGLGVKDFVTLLEQTAVNVLALHDIKAERKESEPGVYVAGEKIAALGLRIRRGYTYHGLSLNVNMDLSPFNNIDPCGYECLTVTQMSELISESCDTKPRQAEIEQQLVDSFIDLLPND